MSHSPRGNIVPHWINGCEADASSGRTFEVLNPLDDHSIATAALGNEADLDCAAEAAGAAFREFRDTSVKAREGWLISAADRLENDAESFVELLIDQTGSAISKARREVATAVGVLRAAAGSVRRISGQTMPSDVPQRWSLSFREPLGVVAAITPFNVPLIKGIKHTAMPLATGNTVVMLPSPEAPSIAVRIAQLYHDVGVPAGMVNVVCGYGSDIGDHLTAHPAIQAVAFTGSTQVGRHIAQRCGRWGKRVTLEMGGKNPLIVLPDADLERAVAASLIGAFLYQGQICLSASRILVADSRVDEFTKKIVAAASGLSMGNLRDPNTMIGPIINPRQRQRIRDHISEASELGATLCTGGQWEGNRCQPTILRNVPSEAALAREETFGPVTTIASFGSEQEAIALANSTPYGLVASVFTKDLDVATRMARRLSAGMVHVNTTTIQEEAHVPFGGVGDSGFGREGAQASIDALTQWKWITINPTEP